MRLDIGNAKTVSFGPSPARIAVPARLACSLCSWKAFSAVQAAYKCCHDCTAHPALLNNMCSQLLNMQFQQPSNISAKMRQSKMTFATGSSDKTLPAGLGMMLSVPCTMGKLVPPAEPMPCNAANLSFFLGFLLGLVPALFLVYAMILLMRSNRALSMYPLMLGTGCRHSASWAYDGPLPTRQEACTKYGTGYAMYDCAHYTHCSCPWSRASSSLSMCTVGLLLTGGQSSLDRLRVVGTSVLLSCSSKSYTKALRIGRNISLAGALNGLNSALYTACPVGVANLISCTAG